jgi:hypothetical protein
MHLNVEGVRDYIVALIAIYTAVFALAQTRVQVQTGQAFQASSPKLSRAAPNRVAPFFALSSNGRDSVNRTDDFYAMAIVRRVVDRPD